MAYKIIIGRDETDRKKLGEKGTVFIGKQYVRMEQTTSLSNEVYLDVARAHVILVCGKRGSGKCLHGDTLITLKDGRVKPIKELENDQNEILSLNEKFKIKPKKRTEFFKRKVKRLVEVELRSGREIKLTPEHPLLTIKGWKPLEELNLGSRIAVPRKEKIFGENYMPECEIKLLAYLIAEGHTKKIVLFSNSDEEIIEEFRQDLKKFDNSLELIEEKRCCYRISSPKWKNICLDSSKMIFDRKKRCWAKGSKIILKKRSIREFLERENIFGKSSLEKEIPESVFMLNKTGLALFLNRLFSCDGSIYSLRRGDWEISYSSSSNKLIKQVQHLLLRYSVLSKLRHKKIKYNKSIRKSYELILNGINVVKFINEIGFFGKKSRKMNGALEYFSTTIRNPNVDTIPKEIWETYTPDNWAEIGRGVSYAHPKAMRERIKYAPSRQTLLQIAKIDNHNSLKLLAESDIFWDEIVSLKILDGDFEVYDLCVPEFHNFVANDIIVHNSYSLSVIAESMARLPKDVSKNLSVLIFDTMGIFWTMKFPNSRQESLLEEWDLIPEGLDVDIYTPKGFFEDYKKKGIPTDYSFTIKPSELNAGDWCDTFGVSLTDDIGILIERMVGELGKDFDIDDMINFIKKDKRADKKTKDATENRFVAAKNWGLFSREGIGVKDIIKPGKVSILDVSCYTNVSGSWGIKNLVIGLICNKLLRERMAVRKIEEIEDVEKSKSYFTTEESVDMPLVWVMLDEAHEMLPLVGKTAASDALIQLLREGRQPGISLVLATQQPGEIHKDVMTQSDIVVSHRLTARKDIDALNSMMQSYLTDDIMKYLNQLPKLKGSAIVLDDNSERIYPVRIRPKKSWHGGEAPSAVKIKKKLLDLGL